MKLTSPLYRINTISVEARLGYILGMSGVRQKLIRKIWGMCLVCPLFMQKDHAKYQYPVWVWCVCQSIACNLCQGVE